MVSTQFRIIPKPHGNENIPQSINAYSEFPYNIVFLPSRLILVGSREEGGPTRWAGQGGPAGLGRSALLVSGSQSDVWGNTGCIALPITLCGHL